ncbi:MAG: hypothetical protein HGA85_06900 [Nanoarchaeota archaeon]|nr:hypothetical protein [Nanoarchaeota archaeon]
MEQRIESASYFICDCPVDLGEVSPSGWEQFTALADRGDSYRVHGSFFGQCTEGFAVQLFAYIKRREHWHNWRAAVDKEGAACQDKLRGQHEYAGDFKNSNIRFGVVLAPTEPIKIARPSLISTLCKKPHGNITYQLMDDRTIVYQNI